MSSWQTIDTVLKDGTTIDLWHEEFGRQADCFWGLPEHTCGEAGGYCDSDWHSYSEGWVAASLNIFTFEDGFTHWMLHQPPISSPPLLDAPTPVLITPHMLNAGSEQITVPSYDADDKKTLAVKVFRAMLAARNSDETPQPLQTERVKP